MIMLAAAFDPMQFVENLKYMGLGMLGIFIVIGIIAVFTILLNSATAERKQDEKKDQ